MKIKYLDGSDWNWLDSYESKIKRIEGKYSGWISLITKTKVKYPIIINGSNGEYCVFNHEYEGVIFLPENGQWCVSALYDNHGDIVEWYFDIIKNYEITENNNPYYYDLYLDVTLNANNGVTILDEDELKEALEMDIISNYEFNLAYEYCDSLVNGIINDNYFLNEFLLEQKKLMRGEMLNER